MDIKTSTMGEVKLCVLLLNPNMLKQFSVEIMSNMLIPMKFQNIDINKIAVNRSDCALIVETAFNADNMPMCIKNVFVKS